MMELVIIHRWKIHRYLFDVYKISHSLFVLVTFSFLFYLLAYGRQSHEKRIFNFGNFNLLDIGDDGKFASTSLESGIIE